MALIILFSCYDRCDYSFIFCINQIFAKCKNVDEVVFSKLSCYNKDTPTILAVSKRPCQLNQVLQIQKRSCLQPSTSNGNGEKRRGTLLVWKN